MDCVDCVAAAVAVHGGAAQMLARDGGGDAAMTYSYSRALSLSELLQAAERLVGILQH